MALDILVQTMRKVELFGRLSPLQLTELIRRSDRIVYQPGDIIMREGDEAGAAVLIIKGDVVRTAGPWLSTPAEPVPVGSLLAEMAMLVPTQHTSTVVAQSAVRAIRLTRVGVLEQVKADPKLADQLSVTLSARLKAVAAQLREIDVALEVGSAGFQGFGHVPVVATQAAQQLH
jgi:CRP-like cAMP-binding protein